MASLHRRFHALYAPLPLLLAGACIGPGDSADAVVHNQRPFISSDSRTTPAQHMEIETGAQIDPGDRVDTPTFLKYGLGPRSEVFAGLSPYSMVDHDEVLPDGSGLGDSWVGLRHRLRDRDMYYPGVGFELKTKLPTAKPSKGIGTGEMDFFGSINGTQTYRGADVTGYYQLGLLGEIEAAGTDLEHTGAIQARSPFDQRLTGLGEVAFVWAPERDREELTLLLGTSYLLDSYTLFDIGLRLGLTSDAPELQLVFGLSRTLGILDFPAPARPE